MKNSENILSINNMTVSYSDQGNTVKIVDRISFKLRRGEVLGLVGESGCGKTQLALALAGLSSQGLDIEMHSDPPISGLTISMIFQEPLSALNPVLTIGEQIREAFPSGITNKKYQVFQLLEEVGIDNPPQRYSQYPHEFSGGMRQRTLIAMALARNPDILIADEPTTALDVTIQKQIIDLLHELNRTKGISIIFITHDLILARSFTDRIMVMYAGELIESAPTESIYSFPKHPYTSLLIRLAKMEKNSDGKFSGIPGSVPLPKDYLGGCRFHPRCPYVKDDCLSGAETTVTNDGHRFICNYPL